MLHLTRTVRAAIINPKIVHTNRQLANDRKHSFYPIVGAIQTKLGAISLNKPDNNNNITQECCDQLFRFINSFHHDHTVENVFIQNKGKIFSGGADFDELAQNQFYLDKLFRMAIMLANFNKPIFAKVEGPVRGIAAYLINMMSTPMGTQMSSLRLDETARGFIPIIGGSFQLASLPCNLGSYLALTGKKLNRDQMIRLGFLKANFNPGTTSKEFRKKLSDANLYMSVSLPAELVGLSELRRDSLVRTKYQRFKNMIALSQQQIFSSKRNFYNKFALNQYRLAKAEFQNIKNPHTSFSDYNREINNYFAIRLDRPFKFLKNANMIEEAKPQGRLISGLPLEKIIQIFEKNSLQQVLEELKKDGSQWAKQTEKQIRKKDPLAAQITFELIKKAKNLTWVQSLQLQYTIARRLLKNSKLTIQTNDYSSRKIFTNEHSEKKIEQINWQQEKQYYFNPEKQPDQIFDHQVPNHSLLPTTYFYRNFPDSVRNYLNRTFFQDVHVKNSTKQIRRFLQLNNIDYRDQSYDVDVLREHIYNDTRYFEMYELQLQRLRALFSKSSRKFSSYEESRFKFIEQKLKNKTEALTLIENKLKKHFNEYFEKRFEDLQKKTAEISGKQMRMDIFRNYQKTLLNNIVLKGHHYERNNSQSYLFPLGIVRFDGNAKDGGTFFTASETAQEKQNQFLQDLKEQYKNNGTVSQSFYDKYKHVQKNSNMVFSSDISDFEKDQLKREQLLQKKYGKSIIIRNDIAKYKLLMQYASQTSKEVAQLLSWSDQDIQAVLENAPKPQETCLDFVKGLQKNTEKIELTLDFLNNEYDLLIKANRKNLTEAQEKARANFEIKQKFYFLNEKRIPLPFRKIFLNIYNEILEHFIKVYKKQGHLFPVRKQENHILDSWVQKSIHSELTNFIKNDVDYVFSYVGILFMRSLIQTIQHFEIDKQDDEPLQILALLTGFSNQNLNEIDQDFTDLLYFLIDMHGDAKQRILLPQTKLIDFMNRLRINYETSKSMSISFETLMLLIAKDRKRIRDRQDNKTRALGYEPEYHLSLLNQEGKKVINQKKFDISNHPDEEVYAANPLNQNFETAEEISSRFVTNEDQFWNLLTRDHQEGLEQKDQQFISTKPAGYEKETSTMQIPWAIKNKVQTLIQKKINPENQKQRNQLVGLSLQNYTEGSRKKRLILGFEYYVQKLESILHKVAGKDMFLPDESRQKIQKQCYENTRCLMRTDLSNEEWLDLELDKCIKNLLQFRSEKQKYFTKAELECFDEQFFELFSPNVIELLLKNQFKQQEQICRELVKHPLQKYQKDMDHQEKVEDFYSRLKNAVKNPFAIKMINNLVMARSVLIQRNHEIEVSTKTNQQLEQFLTRQENQQLKDQLKVQIPEVTFTRLINEAFRYRDDEEDSEAIRQDMYKALGRKQKQTTKFLEEIKMIKNELSDQKIKDDLSLRISRLEMIQ